MAHYRWAAGSLPSTSSSMILVMLVLQGGKTNIVQHGPVDAPHIPAGVLLVYESGTRGRIWNISVSVFLCVFFFPITCRCHSRLLLCLWSGSVRPCKCHPSASICSSAQDEKKEEAVSYTLERRAIHQTPNPPQNNHPASEACVPNGLRSQEKGDWWLDKWRELRKPFICFYFWLSLFTHRSWAVVPPSHLKVSEWLMTWCDVF